MPRFYGMAFVSGMAALVYQVVWVHSLTLTFGSTTASAAVVIAAFMAGLGVGARLYEVAEKRWKNSVLLYAGIELGIAITAAGLTLCLPALPRVYASLTATVGTGALLGIVRFVTSFLLLLIPSALMGATFPALSVIVIRSPQGIRRHLGMIYGVNTLGAATGTLLSGFVLIELFGNTVSVWIANLLNIAVAAAAFTVRQRVSVPPRTGHRATEPGQAVPSPLPPAVLAAVLVASSFATMAYELIWMRAAKYLVGNSTYAISLVLALFLVGLGLGAAAHRLITRRYRPEMALTVSQVLTAVLALTTISLIGLCLSNDWLAHHVSIFSRDVRFLPWPQRLAITGSVATAILLPATIAMGLMFPLASSMFIERMPLLGRKLGSAYLLSNLGSIAGVIAAAFYIVPMLGTMTGTKVVAGINIAIALLLLKYVWDGVNLRAIAIVAVGALSVLFMLLQPSRLPFKGEDEQDGKLELEFWEEGRQATVKVLSDPSTGDRTMTIDGYSIGVSRSWHREAGYKQTVLAHLPMALAPGIKRSLNIGLGSGSTMLSLGEYPSVEQLDCVEISQAVVDGARLFDEGKILDDPRTRVFVDDAVHYLLTTRMTYDVIISDGKQNPQFPGNSTLLARDFYELAVKRLSPDGIFVQWIPLNHDTRSFRVILRTFEQVFPHMAVYYFPPSCIVMVGTRVPMPSLGGMLDETIELPARAAWDLAPYHILDRNELLAGCTAIGAGLQAAIGDGPINTWDEPRLEFLPYKQWNVDSNQAYFRENLGLLVDGKPEPLDVIRPTNEALQRAFLSAAVMRKGFLAVMRTLNAETLRPYCERALELNPGDGIAQGYEARIKYGVTAVLSPSH